MIKKIISQLIILLIIISTAMSIFWFFKTSAVKKQVLALIAASEGKVSAVSVSVSGFPFKQKLVIDDLKFQLSTNLSQNPIIPSTDKYQIIIKKLEAVSSILSGNFKVNNSLDVGIQDQNGTTRSLQFNQPPQAGFLIIGGELTKLSYQDSGYKILDEGKNILFENGNSSINFESAIVDNKYHNKIRVEFKDVGMFFGNANNIAPATKENVSDVAIPTTDSSPVASENSSPNSDVAKSKNTANPGISGNTHPNAAIDTNNVAKQVQPVTTTTPADGGLIKKSFIVDLEYVVNKPSLSPTEVPTPNKEPQIAEVVVTHKPRLESLTIKNFEISSPLYKVNINGEASSFPQDSLPIASISVRIEKFDNLLITLKSPISMLVELALKSRNVQNVPAQNVNNVSAANVVTPTSLANALPVAQNNDQKPMINIEALIRDIAKKNPATTDDVVVFDFRKELGKDLIINEMPLTEIINQGLLPVNNNPLNNPAYGATALPATQPVANVTTSKTIESTTAKNPPVKAQIYKSSKPTNAN